VSTTTQIQRQPEYIEKRAEQLLASVFGDPNATRRSGESDADFNLRKFGRAGISQPVPAFQFAGFTPQQQQAFGLASQNVGAFQPALQRGMSTADLGVAGLIGGTQAFQPSQSQAFMDPYQQQVTQQALAELDRQGDQARNRLAGQATRAGVFGGSRFGVQEAELDRNLQDIKSRRIFEDLSRNFQQAQRAAMGAQESQQRRQLMAGQQLGNLGRVQAGLGALGQQLGQQDVQSLLGVGGLQQQLGQAQLEAQRQQQVQAQREPFTRLGFASDILRGTPSGGISYIQEPSTSPFAQALGLGIAGLGALGQFGQGFGGVQDAFSGIGNIFGGN
tara:strand:- start:301 stop:1296 length:996 start_codon:yes stop_codon:yes gene_type:complete